MVASFKNLGTQKNSFPTIYDSKFISVFEELTGTKPSTPVTRDLVCLFAVTYKHNNELLDKKLSWWDGLNNIRHKFDKTDEDLKKLQEYANWCKNTDVNEATQIVWVIYNDKTGNVMESGINNIIDGGKVWLTPTEQLNNMGDKIEYIPVHDLYNYDKFFELTSEKRTTYIVLKGEGEIVNMFNEHMKKPVMRCMRPTITYKVRS